jgi:dTMP kinase
VPLSPLAEPFLYCADRTQHVDQVLRPALGAGAIVLCDRLSDSTIAYQGYGRELDLDAVRTVDARARSGLWPELTFLLGCPVEEGLSRVRGRTGPGDRFEREGSAFHHRVRSGFLALGGAEPIRFCVLDSSQPIDRVQTRVIAEAERRLGGAT